MSKMWVNIQCFKVYQIFGTSCCVLPLPRGARKMKSKHFFSYFFDDVKSFKSASTCILLHRDQVRKEKDETTTLQLFTSYVLLCLRTVSHWQVI